MPFCSVIDCQYRNTRSSYLRIFQLPPGVQPFLANQRRLWQHAIQEANGGTETPLVNLRVCAAHFISGEASSDFESPDFVPSVFPCTQEIKTRSQEIETDTPQSKTHTPERKTRSQESKTHTPERKTRSQESKTHTPERKTRSQESKTHTPERKTRSQESKTHTPERKTRSHQSKTHTPERKTRSHQSKTHTPERKTRSQESKTHTPERKTRSQESKTRTPESKTSTPESKTSTPESKTSTPERWTRSQESKICSQQRENRKRKKKWKFYSGKRRHCRARSKRDDSALRKAQNELSEEEQQTSSSPSVLKEGETLTGPEKVSSHSQATSRPNEIPPSLPADITALLKRPVLRLKRVVVPTDLFRCESCSKTFTSSSLLEKHKEEHDENSHFICEICGMWFTVQKEFAMHQSNHPKLEPYFPCNICDRSFSTIQHLKRHKLLHVKDGRKCPKCGTLFCQRHNHFLYLPRPEIKSESEGESEEEEEEEEEKAAGEKSQEVECDLIKKEDSPVKTEPNQVTGKPVSANKTQLIIPPTNGPVVTVSVIPLLGVFRDSPMASPRPPHIEILPQISLKTAEPSPLARPHPSVLPSSCPPILKLSSDIHPSSQPKMEAPSSPAEEPFVPKCSDFTPSLKVFSPQYLTSALLEVKRNYEYIFNKPKRFKGMVRKQEEGPLPISSQKHLIKPGMRRRVAYDLEVVL